MLHFSEIRFVFRMAKLRKSVGAIAHKKDVLVQTSTGFFRFQGISRKFTQKLYEWEKAKGIRPEASTIALLNTGFNHTIGQNEIPSTSHVESKFTKFCISIQTLIS